MSYIHTKKRNRWLPVVKPDRTQTKWFRKLINLGNHLRTCNSINSLTLLMTFQNFWMSLNSHLTILCSAIIANKSYYLGNLLGAKHHIRELHANSNFSKIMQDRYFYLCFYVRQWRAPMGKETSQWSYRQTEAELNTNAADSIPLAHIKNSTHSLTQQYFP